MVTERQMDLKELIMKLVSNELHAFRRRGGDELSAGWREGTHLSFLELHNPHLGLKHEVYLAISEGKCDLKITDYGVSEFRGVRCAAAEAVILDSSYDFFSLPDDDGPSPDALRKFTRRFARVLDENLGRYQPIRDYGVAVTRNARHVLKAVDLALPEEGSISLVCNNDPPRETGDDEIVFITQDADMLDLCLRLSDDTVTAWDTGGVIATFDQTQLMSGLKNLVEERLAAYQSALRP